MSMTLDEMKLAVCEKLPEKFVVFVHTDVPVAKWRDAEYRMHQRINWPTEGLQVCHEAEKLLCPIDSSQYCELLNQIADRTLNRDYKLCEWYRGKFVVAHATYEQRLEALCRVWFPERFTK